MNNCRAPDRLDGPASEKRYEPGVLREQLGPLFERYPGLRLLTMDALYAERDLCQAIAGHGRDYLVRIKGNGVRGAGGINRRVCRGRVGGAAGRDPGKKAGAIEKTAGFGPMPCWAAISGMSWDFPGRGRVRWWGRRAWI